MQRTTVYLTGQRVAVASVPFEKPIFRKVFEMDEQTNSNSLNDDTLSQILQELKTLNENVTEYKEYIYKRNEDSDKESKAKAEEEAKVKADAEKAEAEKEQAKQESADITNNTLAELTGIHSVLSDFSDTYKQAYTETASINDNLEYNSNMQFVVSSIGVGLLALLFGFIFARTVFRKL